MGSAQKKVHRRQASELSGVVRQMFKDTEKMKKIIDLLAQNAAVVDYFQMAKGCRSAPYHQTIYIEYDSEGNETIVREPSGERVAERAENVVTMRKALLRQAQARRSDLSKLLPVSSELDEIEREKKLRARKQGPSQRIRIT